MVWGFFFFRNLGALVPLNGKVSATVYKDILDNCMLPTFWQQFREDPFLFQHNCVPVYKARLHKDMVG